MNKFDLIEDIEARLRHLQTLKKNTLLSMEKDLYMIEGRIYELKLLLVKLQAEKLV